MWHLEPALKPLPCPGNYFSRASIRLFKKPPKSGIIYGASWYTMSDDYPNGPFCHVLGELDADRKLHIVQEWHGDTLSEAARALWLINEGIWRVNAESASKLASLERIRGVLSWFCEPDQMKKAAATALDDHGTRVMAAWSRAGRPDKDKPRPPSLIALDEVLEIGAAAALLQGYLSTGDVVIHEDSEVMLRELCSWPAVPSSARVGALAVLVSGSSEMTAPLRRRRGSFRQRTIASWVE